MDAREVVVLPAPSVRRLLALAWPIIVSRSSQVVVGVSDAVLVAHLGESALAATTTGATNSFSLLILPMGLVFIVSTFSSQLCGAGDATGARRYGYYGLLVAAVAQALCMLGILAVPAFLGLLDYTPEVRHLMTGYMAMRLLSGGAAVGIEALANYYGGLGNTRLPMRASVAAMTLNVAGNWILIDGHLGAPALGVRGSALASAIATWLAFLGLLAHFLLGGRPRKLSLGELGRMLRIGLPVGLNWFLEFAAFAFFVNVVVTGLGTTALAAMMTVLQISSVSFMPAFGLASAGAILVGQSIGAGLLERVAPTVRLTFICAAIWESTVGVAYVAIPTLLLWPFVRRMPNAQALVLVGAPMLALSAGWQLFDAAASTLAEALRAAGDTTFTLWMRVALAWALFAPGSYISIRWFGGGVGAAIGWLVAYLGALALALYLRFRAGAWRKITLVPAAAAAETC